MLLSALIKTIGRPTLQNAVDSAVREGITPIVVSDGYLGDIQEGAVVLPKNWGTYGSVAANVGVGFCETPYLMILDDDDELAEGAGDVIRRKIDQSPDIDIWIPGLLFNNGMVLCDGSNKKIVPANVAVPIAKVEVFTNAPFRSKIPDPRFKDYADYFQIAESTHMGHTVDWIGENTYLVRPKLEGTNGRGI